MGRPRRCGPCSRNQSWLSLCKKNLELRKLIPIYFPSSVYSPSTDLAGNTDNTNPIDCISDQINGLTTEVIFSFVFMLNFFSVR